MSSKYQDELGLIVMDNIKEFGESVDKHLMKKRNTTQSFIIPKEEIRFSSGDGKVMLKDSTREKDLYIISDVGNNGMVYKMAGYINHMSPDDHFQDIKRVISADGGEAARLSVFMPLLYASRQHKRHAGESLDCPLALQELERLNVKEIITCDAHDPRVENALSTSTSFDSFYVTNELVHSFIVNEDFDPDKIIIISPDTGAVERAIYNAGYFNSDVGMFYKRRDYSRMENGKNPIVAHDYLGTDLLGMTVIITDDMISSGGSMIDTAKNVKQRGATKVIMITTFAMFVEGLEEFDKAYENGIFDAVYSTNLTYVDQEVNKRPWYHQVDCSSFAADIIDTLNSGNSTANLKNGKQKVMEMLDKKKKGSNEKLNFRK